MKKEEKQSQSKIDNNFGVSSVMLGITSIALTLNAPITGIILGIISLVFASKQNSISPNKWSKNGRTLGIVGVVLGVALLIILTIIYKYLPQLLQLT